MDMLEDCDFYSAHVYIEPPEVHELTDGDSRDEVEAWPKFHWRQLCARTAVMLHNMDGRQLLGEDVSQKKFILDCKNNI